MAIQYTQTSYSSDKGILAFPDHYVAYPQVFASNSPLAVLVDGRLIIPAGTIYPANNATAIGIVMHNYDVTSGDVNGAIILHGFIKTSALPAVPSATALAALTGIHFIPAFPVVVTFDVLTEAAFTVADPKDTEAQALVEAEGSTFRPDASDPTKWTIVGESGTKISVTKIDVSPGGKYVTVTLTATAAAVAGVITMLPDAEVMSLGTTAAAAVQVAEVTA